MDNLIRGSFLWRLWRYLAGIWPHSALHRAGAALGRSFRASKTRRLGRRVFGCSTAMTDHAGAAGLLRRCNHALWRLGQRLMPAVRASWLYRIYGAVFRCGRGSRILGWLFGGGMTAFILAAVGLYSVADYVLRDMLAVPVLSSVWDEALLLLAVLWILYDRMRAPAPMAARVNPLDLPVLLFVGVGLALMFLVSPFFSIAVAGYRATVQYLLWFFVLTRLIRSDRDFRTLYLVLVLAAFVISLHGIYQFVVAVPIPENWVAMSETAVRTRVYSIFGSPNIMADFMVMFAPMAAGLAYFSRRRGAKIAWWLVTFSMCFACLFTMSRAGWAGMAVAILVFALLVDRRLLVLMAVACVAALFLPFVASRIGFLLTSDFVDAHSNGGRGSRWMYTMLYLEASPVFGLGLGMFGGAVAMQNQVYKWMSYFYVDNYYLKILAEMGWVGLTFFLLMMAALLFVGLRAVYRTAQEPKASSHYPLCAGMLAGLCGVLVHCYFENIFEEPYMMAYFWSIAAMIVYLGFLRRKPDTTEIA